MKIKLYIIFCLILLPISLLYGQIWPKFYGPINAYKNNRGIIEHYDKGFIFSSIMYYLNDSYNSWIVKTDINGNVLWKKTLVNNQDYVVPFGLAGAKDGGILICGALKSGSNNICPFVLKLDACGEKEWCKIFISNLAEDPCANDIKLTEDGNIIILLSFFGNFPYESIHLAKLSPNGELIWIKPLATKYDDPTSDAKIPLKLALTSQEKFLILGYGYWQHPWEPLGPYWIRSFYLKADTDGNEEWILPFSLTDTLFGKATTIFENDIGSLTGIGVNYTTKNDSVFPYFIKISLDGQVEDYKIINPRFIYPNIPSVGINEIISFDDFYYSFGSMPIERVTNFVSILDKDLFNKDSIFLNSALFINHGYANYSFIGTFDSKIIINDSYFPSPLPLRNEISLYKLNLNLEYDTAYTGNLTYDSLCTSGLQQSGFIYLDDCDIILGTENLSEIKSNDQNLIITVYPSPAKDHLSFTFKNAQQYQNLELKCFNMLGLQQSESISLKGQQQISMNTINWQPGIYIAVLYNEGKPVGKEKFIIY